VLQHSTLKQYYAFGERVHMNYRIDKMRRLQNKVTRLLTTSV